LDSCVNIFSALDLPNIKNDTRSQIGHTNESFELDCDVNASDADWFTWTKDGNTLSTGERIKIKSNGGLTFKNLYNNDSGEYACSAGRNQTQTRGQNISLAVIGKLLSTA
jgi:hypothetical protein